MNDANPIDLLFGGMEKLGPGSNADTLKMLDRLPRPPEGTIVDAGCGTGRQTLALANRLRLPIQAVDAYAPFLADLARRANEAGMAHLIQTHCMDMADIPHRFREIDLLWSEGAAYNIGFPHALETWYPALKPQGFAVVSELAWLRAEAPATARRFFRTGYPQMRHIDENRSLAEAAGYHILDTHTLPDETWVEGYYDILEPRAKALLTHPEEAVRDFAAETLEEIRIFGCSEGSYGYVFYVLRKA
ncbi:MAG: class I SAM-dependent methyltransferase [Candidatus Thiosymbion ectosymbiont of Robbea hypermnestra]|nr:class I SAM-dependent methyltransferase [Candidatus Thiosymbion ectosymbiont of Robbea hypermnestra]